MLMHTDVPVTGTQTFLFVEMRSRTMYHLLLSCHPLQQAAFLVPPGLFAGINPRGGAPAYAIFSSKGQTRTLDEANSSFKSEIPLAPLFSHHFERNEMKQRCHNPRCSVP
jgi:hypothetical protein